LRLQVLLIWENANSKNDPKVFSFCAYKYYLFEKNANNKEDNL